MHYHDLQTGRLFNVMTVHLFVGCSLPSKVFVGCSLPSKVFVGCSLP
jgi:hypothetical protein